MALRPGRQPAGGHAAPLAEWSGPARFRLEVAARDVQEVVRVAGGLICDRVLAGWDVLVSLSAGGDTRSLRILGAEVLIPESEPVRFGEHHAIKTFAVSTDLLTVNPRLREHAVSTLGQPDGSVLLWGDAPRIRLPSPPTPMRYRMSAAALSFKREALRAAPATPGTSCRTERFYSLDHRAVRVSHSS